MQSTLSSHGHVQHPVATLSHLVDGERCRGVLQENVAESNFILSQHSIQLPCHLRRERILCGSCWLGLFLGPLGASKEGSHLTCDEMASPRLGFKIDLALLPFRHGGPLLQLQNHDVSGDKCSSNRPAVQLNATQSHISVTCSRHT